MDGVGEVDVLLGVPLGGLDELVGGLDLEAGRVAECDDGVADLWLGPVVERAEGPGDLGDGERGGYEPDVAGGGPLEQVIDGVGLVGDVVGEVAEEDVGVNYDRRVLGGVLEDVAGGRSVGAGPRRCSARAARTEFRIASTPWSPLTGTEPRRSQRDSCPRRPVRSLGIAAGA